MMGSNDRSFPVPQTRMDGQQVLPTSAPVSSLLPPIPSNHNQLLQHHLQASIQAQLAALLTHGTSQPPVVASPVLNLGVPNANPTHLLAANAVVAPAVGSVPPNPLVPSVDMHGWSVEQIESHIDLLRQLKQEIPQKVTLLLQDAKKRADKRHAKRIANRQSACTSRARKKALVEEMTALNARLRRQALILSLLPDLVIVIDTEGIITFCSAQVERVLHHNIDELIGAKLIEIIEPGSRDKFSNLIHCLLKSSGSEASQDNWKARALSNSQNLAMTSDGHGPNDSTPVTKKKKKAPKADGQGEGNDDSAYETSGAGANTVTETSFPLSVVQVGQVNATVRSSLDENDNSDASNSKQPSSLTGNSVAGNSGCDEVDHKNKSSNIDNTKTLSKEDTSISQSSDASNTSSQTISSNAQNLLSANANLERNVRHHNKKIMKDKRAAAGYKDDVLGAAVTANNASARLSSLQHLRSTDSSEEDSGYRESNDSREETSSSSDGEAPPKRNSSTRKTIAPTCNVCLIRSDLSTIWCEVTSSLRTKDSDDEECDTNSWVGVKKPSQSLASVETASHKPDAEETSIQKSEEGEPKPKIVPQVKEILLCLRPIRDGDGKTDEVNRFNPKRKADHVVSEDNRSSEATSTLITDAIVQPSSSVVSSVNTWSAKGNRRKRASKDSLPLSNKKKQGASDEDIDTAVVESLILMSNKKV